MTKGRLVAVLMGLSLTFPIQCVWAVVPTKCVSGVNELVSALNSGSCSSLINAARLNVPADCQLYLFGELAPEAQESIKVNFNTEQISKFSDEKISRLFGELKGLVLGRVQTCTDPVEQIERVKEQAKAKVKNGSSKSPQVLQDMLVEAAERGDLNAVSDLINAGASPNKPDTQSARYPALVAAFGGHFEVLRHLRDHGLNVNQKVTIKVAKTSTTRGYLEWLKQECKDPGPNSCKDQDGKIEKAIRILFYMD